MGTLSRLVRLGTCLVLGLLVSACAIDDYTPPTPPGQHAGDACTSLTEIAQGESLSLFDDTSRGTDLTTASPMFSECMAGERIGKELVFPVRPSSPGTLVATLHPQYAHHWLHTWTACPGSAGDVLDCSLGSMVEDNDVNQIDDVQAGATYYVVVDGWMDEAGEFELMLELK
ncbi:hypothetical protein [Polyangium jinanense]|uniref:Lipoprotein n=1 Tax=Polyangium jinanense TaxID=2829994 RepID=A0A9X3XDA3_9BACT|nr:hypothetical protein [Polyangium jinanense]MDC3960605.1 hypothetical protein [Polyangium jinanense]MDC3986893.1 hypothetical protein [Polyangium jinanense]